MSLYDLREDIIVDYKSTIRQLEDIKNEHQQYAAKVFHRMALMLFDKFPEIQGFRWYQYEPWNDGAETEFEIFSDRIDVLIDDTWFLYWDMEEEDEELPYDWERWNTATEAATKLINFIPPEVMEFSFGNGSEIEVTKSGITITGYVDG